MKSWSSQVRRAAGPRRTRATLIDLAGQAGVSIKTVLRVLNGAANVSAKTASQMRAAAVRFQSLAGRAGRHDVNVVLIGLSRDVARTHSMRIDDAPIATTLWPPRPA